jgi:hypothetical protein
MRSYVWDWGTEPSARGKQEAKQQKQKKKKKKKEEEEEEEGQKSSPAEVSSGATQKRSGSSGQRWRTGTMVVLEEQTAPPHSTINKHIGQTAEVVPYDGASWVKVRLVSGPDKGTLGSWRPGSVRERDAAE